MDWTTNPNLNLLAGPKQQRFSSVVTRNRKVSYGDTTLSQLRHWTAKSPGMSRCHWAGSSGLSEATVDLRSRTTHPPSQSYRRRRPEVSRSFKLQIFSIPTTNYPRIFNTMTGYFNVVLASLLHSQRPSHSSILCHVCYAALNFLQDLL